MRRAYNHHHRFRSKNPFLGEEFLVFANDGGSEGSAAPPLPKGPSKTPAEEFHDEVQKGPKPKEMGELVELFADDPRPPLTKAVDHYQYLAGQIRFYERINRYLQTTTEDFDMGALPWSKSGESIEEAVSNLEEKVANLDLDIDPETWTSIRNSEERDQRQEMINVMVGIYEKLEAAKNEQAQVVHNEYIKHYVSEYDGLIESWENTPDVYQDYAKEKIAQYKVAQAHLKKQIENRVDVDDEAKLMELLRSYKGVLDNEKNELVTARQEVENPVNLSEVELMFRGIQKVKRVEFSSRYEEYKSKIGSILTALERVKNEVARSDLDDTERGSRIKKVDGLIKKYKEGLEGAEGFAANTFSNPDIHTEKDENGKDVPKTMKGVTGEPVFVPKGLKERIELLKSGALSPDETNVLATGVMNEMKSMKQAIDAFVDDVDTNFDKTLTALHDEDIEGPVRSPGFSMNIEIVWMSPMDVWKMVENASESFKRSFERSRMRKVGKVGSAITSPLSNLNFGPFQHFSVIPGDLAKKDDSAEDEAVSHYKDHYKSGDDNSVIALLHEARNPDQLKACLQLLAERGRLNWFDPKFLEQLNRRQSVIYFDTVKIEKFHANEPAFHRGLSTALEAIYGDADMFRNLNAQNSSAYNSGKEKFKQELINMSRSRGGLQKVAVEMLKEHYNAGESSTVNPQKFEYVIELGVIEGAVQPAELGLYFLIQAANTGLLPYERLVQLYANKANDIPYLEVLNEGIFNQQVLKQWASIDPIPHTFDTLAAYSVPHNYMRWFHTFVMHNPRVRDRASKIVSGGRDMDSDLAALFIPYASENSAINILQVLPSGAHAEEWLLNNIWNYELLTLHNQLAHMDEMENEQDGKFSSVKATSELTNMVAGFVKKDSVMSARYLTTGSKKYVKWTETLKNQKPRSSFVNGFFWDGGEKDATGKAKYGTVYDYVIEARKIITQLDPEIFDILFKQGIPTKAEVDRIVKIASERYNHDFDGVPPQNADALYEKIAGLIGAVVEKQNMEGGTLKNLIKNVTAGHQKFYDKQNEGVPDEQKIGGTISFYPSIDSEGNQNLQAANNNNWHHEETTGTSTGFRLAS